MRIRQKWLLQPFEPRACDRRCPGHEDRGNEPWRRAIAIRGRSGRRKPNRAPEPRKSGWSSPARGEITQEGGSRGRPRETPIMGLGRSRWCSWIVEIAGIGARRPSPVSESCRKGHDVEARRSDPATSSSFDEAAVEKDRVLPQKEHDRERQRQARDRPDGRKRQREGALLGRLSIKSLQVRAGRVPRETRGHRAPRQSWGLAVKRGSTRGHVVC